MSSPSPDTTTSRRRRGLPSPRPSGAVGDEAGAEGRGRDRDRSDASRDSHQLEHRDGASEVKDVVMVGMGAALLVTTPLAVLTLRRWWHWWNKLP